MLLVRAIHMYHPVLDSLLDMARFPCSQSGLLCAETILGGGMVTQQMKGAPKAAGSTSCSGLVAQGAAVMPTMQVGGV